MNDSLSQVLCVSSALRILQHDSMSATVVLGDLHVIGGNVSSPLLKISHRIALSRHQARNQAVRFNQAPVWIIYKSALNRTTSFQKVRELGCLLVISGSDPVAQPERRNRTDATRLRRCGWPCNFPRRPEHPLPSEWND